MTRKDGQMSENDALDGFGDQVDALEENLAQATGMVASSMPNCA